MEYRILVLAAVLVIAGVALSLVYGNMFSAGQFSLNYSAAGGFSVGVFAAGTLP